MLVESKPSEIGEFAVQNLAAGLACNLATVTFFIYPIHKVYYHTRVLHDRSSFVEDKSRLKLSMKVVLHEPKYAREKCSFLHHIENEFAVDQFLFYEAALDFAEDAGCGQWNGDKLCTKIMEIYDTYIRRDANQEVRISDVLVSQQNMSLSAGVCSC